jgi:hypothetical protein
LTRWPGLGEKRVGDSAHHWPTDLPANQVNALVLAKHAATTRSQRQAQKIAPKALRF